MIRGMTYTFTNKEEETVTLVLPKTEDEVIASFEPNGVRKLRLTDGSEVEQSFMEYMIAGDKYKGRTAAILPN